MRSAARAAAVAVIGTTIVLASGSALSRPALATMGSAVVIPATVADGGSSAPLTGKLFTSPDAATADCCQQFGFDAGYPGGGWPGQYGFGYPGGGWPGQYGFGYPGGGWPGQYGYGYPGGGWPGQYGFGFPGSLGYPGGGAPGQYGYGYGYPGGGLPGQYGLGGLGYPGGAFSGQPGIGPAGAGGDQFGQPAAAQPTASRLTIGDNYYLPAQISFPVGTRVSWYNSGNSPHTVTSPGNSDSGTIAPGSRWAADFRQPGTFSYQCTIHPEMQGQLTITP